MNTTKILLGIPTNRNVKPQTVLSLLNMVNRTKVDKILMATGGYTIAENRNYLATQALKEKCTHLMMIDDDMTFPEDTLERLLKDDKEFVGVVAHSRSMPPLPVVTLLDQEKISTADALLGRQKFPETLFKVKGIGGSILLLKTEIFNRIEKPWFSFESYESGWTKTGEDYWFCERASKAGIDIWCDPTLKIGHLGEYIF